MNRIVIRYIVIISVFLFLNPYYVISQDSNINYKLGMVQLITGDNEAAIRYFTKSIEANENIIDAYYNRGISYQKSGKVQKAINDLSYVIDNRPTMHQAFNSRGLMYYKENEFLKAKGDFSECILLNPSYPFTYLYRSNTNLKLELYSEALSDAETVLASLSNYINAHKNAAIASAKLGQYQKSLTHYNFLLIQSPSNPDYYVQRARVYVAVGDNKKACKDFKQSVALGSGEAKFDIQKACK